MQAPIAVTRALAHGNKQPVTTKIIDYLPSYWSKGPNIDQITFHQLMTHTSGFRVAGSDMSFRTLNRNVLVPEHQFRHLPDPAFGPDRRSAGRHDVREHGLWESGVLQIEQSLAYFLPEDMELVVLANSPIGATNQFFRDVITDIYLDNI